MVAAPRPGPRRRYWAVIAALAVAVAPSACGPGRPKQPRAVRSAAADIRGTVWRGAATRLCDAESAKEMGVGQLGGLYDAGPAQYVTVQKGESAARQRLRDGLAALAVTGADRNTLRTLVNDESAVLDARAHLLQVIGGQPARTTLNLLTGPPPVTEAYHAVVGSYLSAGRDFLAAGLAACATPLITVLGGPGQDEASAATVEFRVAAACHTVGYTTRSERPTQLTRGTATLGTVVQPGTGRPGDGYDGSSGPVAPPVGPDEAIVLTSVHYPVDSATCVPAAGTATQTPGAN